MTPAQSKSARKPLMQSTATSHGRGLMMMALREVPPEKLRLKIPGSPRWSLMFGGFRQHNGRRLIGF